MKKLLSIILISVFTFSYSNNEEVKISITSNENYESLTLYPIVFNENEEDEITIINYKDYELLNDCRLVFNQRVDDILNFTDDMIGYFGSQPGAIEYFYEEEKYLIKEAYKEFEKCNE